jgi:hypothetical protein
MYWNRNSTEYGRYELEGLLEMMLILIIISTLIINVPVQKGLKQGDRYIDVLVSWRRCTVYWQVGVAVHHCYRH